MPFIVNFLDNPRISVSVFFDGCTSFSGCGRCAREVKRVRKNSKIPSFSPSVEERKQKEREEDARTCEGTRIKKLYHITPAFL